MTTQATQTGWKETTLGEVAQIKGGKRLPLGANLQKRSNQHPYIKITNVVNNRIEGVDEYVPDEVFPSIQRYIVDAGDIIVSIVGTIGSVAQVPDYLNKANLTENCVKVLPEDDKLHKRFLYYFLISSIGQGEIKKNTVGAVQAKLPIYGVQNISLLLPDIADQCAIAGILSAFDDKIELLRKQNETLESIAQGLFKEWFVDFNFQNEQGKPYRKSGGKMVDSERGEVPKEWKIGKLGEITEIKGGTTPSTANPDFWNGDICWTSPKDLSDFKGIFLKDTKSKITPAGLKQIGSGLLPVGTVLLSSRAPIGYLAITVVPLAINQGYIAIIPREDYKNYFVYLWLKQNMQHIVSAANGSTFLEISKSSFRNIEILIPRIEEVKDFLKIVEPIFNKMLNNEAQIQNLSTLRNSLLPRLMRGDIKPLNN